MQVSGISSASYAAMAAGARATMKSHVMRAALETAGIVDANFAAGLDALQAQANAVTQAGAAAAQQDLLGSLIDALA